MVIYDRWGNLVFQTRDRTDFWDGTSGGDYLDEGVYTYIIRYVGGDKEGNQKLFTNTGNVTLLR
jgi:gliding motility-associated-like protein